MRLFHIASIGLILVGAYQLAGQETDASGADAKRLDAVRTAAMEYTKNLPNFICDQTTHRSTSTLAGLDTGTGISSDPSAMNVPAMLQGDSGSAIEEKLTFIGGHENYAVVSVDGKKVSGVEHLQLEGAITTGEFGSRLRDIFDRNSHAEISGGVAVTLHGHRAYAYKYHVPRDHGITVVHKASGQQIVAAYGGKIVVDAERLDVLQIESTLDVSPQFPIQVLQTRIEYKPVMIGSKTYNLPFHCEVRMKDRSNLYVNQIDYRRYQRFAVESTIHYGNGDSK